MLRRDRLCALFCLGMLLLAGGLCRAIEDLTFLQLSDPHVPHALAQTRSTLASMPLGGPVEMAPYGVSAPPVSFAIVTGDLNEFGGGAGAWEQYMSLWAGLDIPLYHQLGNHDNTWDCGRPRLVKLHGSPFYSFERGGITFIGWDTATPQDPRPSIATEGIEWLKRLLLEIPPGRPVIFFCHHPLDGKEFAGAWERARVLDILQRLNTVLVLVGHGHGVRAWQVEGLDMVMGGSTFGKRPGFGIVSIQGGVLRVCHQYADGEMVPLLEKAIHEAEPAVQLWPELVMDGQVLRDPEQVRCWLSTRGSGAVEGARWTLDGGQTGEMAPSGGRWEAFVETTGLDAGAHVLRFEATEATGRSASRSLQFWVDSGDTRLVSVIPHSASSRSGPVIEPDGRIYLGFTNGNVSCYESGTGTALWTQGKAGAGVYGGIAVDAQTGSIYCGGENGHLYAYAAGNARCGDFNAGSPVYAPPLVVGDHVIVATASGEIIALEKVRMHDVLWRCDAPEYSIEAGMCASETAVYAGSWDGYVYCLDVETGALNWRAPSAGSDRDAAPRYYSPADCAPVLVGERLFVADRAYKLTMLDALTGERLGIMEKCVAVGSSADGQSAYVRHTDNRVSKLNADGGVVWTTETPTGAIPAAPMCAHGRVLVASNLGVVSMLDAESGALLWSYRAFRDSFVFGSPAYDGRYVYVVDAAGRMVVLQPAVETTG